jgi:Uncharacterised nucleotidyltransferase
MSSLRSASDVSPPDWAGDRMPSANAGAQLEEWGPDSWHPVARHYKGFSLELGFLLRLLGKSHSGQDALLSTEARQIDWQRLFAVTPPELCGYLGHRLSEAGLQSQCPPLLWEKARDARRATAAQWLRLRFELRHLTEQLMRHSIDFVLLKGAVLAFLAYPDCSLRSVTDIDFLVRPPTLTEALEVAYAAGFRCPERVEFAHPQALAGSAVAGEEISLPLEKSPTRVLIEIHTQLESAEPWFPVPVGQAWERTEEADLDGLRVRILDQHEFLFHLVLHQARAHLFCLGLRPILDVHLWVKFQEKRLDWEWIASESLRRGYDRWMYLVLSIVRDTLGTPVPRYFFDRVPPPPHLDRLQQLAYEQIYADRHLDSLVPPRLAITFAQPSVVRAISCLLGRVKPGRVANPTVPPLKMLRSAGLGASVRRFFNDAKVKTPQYVRAFQKGRLRWSNLQQAARLVKGRREIMNTLVTRQ